MAEYFHIIMLGYILFSYWELGVVVNLSLPFS